MNRDLTAEISGVVLAGGRGARMGGVDKGLQELVGQPLIAHVIERLAPQVHTLFISANRHLDTYAAFGHPVLADDPPLFDGPLAGVAAALAACRTPWLVVVPCDAPRLPLDLVSRLFAAATAAGADGAWAHVDGGEGVMQPQPTFMLLRTCLEGALRERLARGERSLRAVGQAHGFSAFVFADAAAFANLNTAQDLAAMASGWTR